jgi:TrmH family RNA methyltransferase
VITSPHNKHVASAVRLKKRAMREKDRRFLVEGAQGVEEALASGASIRDLFVTPSSQERLDDIVQAARTASVPVHSVSPEVMGHLTSTVTPQGVVAVAAFVDVGLDDLDPEAGCIAVMVEVRDPGNAGTILRSADASGAGGVVFTKSSVDVYNPKAVRATAGSLFHVPVVRGEDVEESVEALRERGFAILAASADGDEPVYAADLAAPTAVLFGNEARGLSAEARALADASIRVPIAGRAESLNLAAAATLVLFESARQRSGRPLSEGSSRLARIVAGAAHDIRSPLTALKGFARTLVSKWDQLEDEQRLMMLEGLAHDAVRMETVVSELVDAARLLSGRLELARVPTDLLAAARAVQQELGQWEQAELIVVGDAAVANVDPARLRSMLLAMVESAQWFAEQGPVEVEVRAGPPLRVSVARAQPTVGPGDAHLLFEPREPGTGGGSKVGLFVARGLAEAHGGTIEVDASGRLRLTLTLPSSSARSHPGTSRGGH